ncbi:hypothetical protein LIER_01019 [Lithospermum erythrorhizon]|uniref:IBB domain-containing protein n=1 Tax=Lithospermum erythrorhizon TaxID=34254 RepID=A0AAV3NK77_LITER
MSLRSIERNNIRRRRYKVAMDANEGRQRREDNMIKIRKNGREKNLLVKRGDNGRDSGDDGDGDSESSNQQFKIKDVIYYTTASNVHSNRFDKEVCNGLGKIKKTQEPPLHN